MSEPTLVEQMSREQLLEIVQCLPLTADGVRVTFDGLPSDRRFYDKAGRPLKVLAVGPSLALHCWPEQDDGWFCDEYGGKLPTTTPWRDLYSTRAATVKAAKEGAQT